MADTQDHDTTTRQLILDAEREAQMVSAGARLVITTLALVIFLVAGGIYLPVAPVVLSYLALYAAVSVLSAIFSLRRFFDPRLSLLFTAVDGISLALLIGFALKITGTPLRFHAAVPGFVFAFCILILATMRYTIGPTLVAIGSFAATWCLFAIMTPPPPAAGADPGFFFGTVQNAARWGFLGIATLLGLLSVIRRRRTLETAIAATRASANLSRYLPDRIAALVATQGMDALASGRQQQATILFADIRGFTTLSETLAPAEIGALLSAFRSLVLQEVERHAGIVDKFIGDAVMAVFGVPEGQAGHEKQGIDCALAIRQSLDAWNGARAGQGLPPLGITIGVHSGEVFSGAVGSAERMEFTVLGDSVNIAARLQEIAKSSASGLVASGSVLDRAGRIASPDWRALPQDAIRGRSGRIALFEHLPPAR